MHARFVAAAHEEFIDPHFVGKLLERLLCVADGQRDQDGSRPRRDLGDIETEPVGKQDDLRRNCRNRVVVVLPKEAKINLGKGIDFGDAAHLQNLRLSELQGGVVSFVAGELQPKIRLHRGADIGRPTRINAPATVLVLMLEDVPRGFREAVFRVRGLQQRVQDDVVRLEGRIRLEFPAPVTLLVLLRKQLPPGCIGCSCYPARKIINFSETQLRGGGGSQAGE